MKRLTRLLIIAAINILLVGCGDAMIKVPQSAKDYKGKNYQDVADELKKAGFTKITYSTIEDLTSNSDMADGTVESVSIDGNTSFKARSKYDPETRIEIGYHIIPKLNPPINAKDIQRKNYSEIAQLFIVEGFVNVTANEVYDLDPDTLTSDYINNVYVNKKKEFDVEDEVPFDAPIEIVGHFPYNKYDATISIDFTKNLLFNKYGVNVAIDDGAATSLEHGQNKEIKVRLKEGEHRIIFTSAEDQEIQNEIILKADYNLIAEYKISCGISDIEVNEMFVDYQREISPDEVKVMCSNEDCVKQNYKTVKADLADLGFKNIKSVPLYDIRFGITDKESVEEVTINGSNSFRRGDVFNKNVEIVITYHMYASDNPDKEK